MKNTDPTPRRTFIRHAGLALSAPLAVSAAMDAAPGITDDGGLAARLTRFEDLDAIRALNRAYLAQLLAAGETAAGQAAAARAAAGQTTAAQTAAAARLYADDAALGRLELPATGALRPDRAADEADIVIAADRNSATARLHCYVETEMPIEDDCTLVEMARLQGGGVIRRSEAGTLEGTYVRQPDGWKIAGMSYRPAAIPSGPAGAAPVATPSGQAPAGLPSGQAPATTARRQA